MMLGLLLVAAPLALIVAIGAAVWLEGHVVDRPVETLVPATDENDATTPAGS
ncbi:MAG: hypothetical protein ACRDIX_00865 [Actinomycetota bacterium]